MISESFSISNRRNRKALLINPPIYDTRYWDKWSQPYGLLKIATLLRDKSSKLHLIDCLQPNRSGRMKKKLRGIVTVGNIQMQIYQYGLDFYDINKRLDALDFKPNEVYITSIMTYWWESTRDIIKIIKKKFPKAEVI